MTELDTLIVELRHELAVELPIKLHDSAGLGRGKSTKGGAAGDLGGIEYGTVEPKERASMVGWTGLPFSRLFDKFLDSPDVWGSAYLAHASIQEASDRCHARHMNHQRPGDRYGTCARLIFRVVELHQPLAHAAAMLELTEDGAAELLETMLTYAAQWRTDRFRDLDRGTRAQPERTAQQQFLADHDDTEWERQKWEGIREGYHLPPWNIEWERRMGVHEREGCTRCARKAVA